ncbi:ABC transporter permease [Plantactinospora sp. GCM10030261]|uniref:ABC transporter permease n=1 Tax=Plantactinospora sp. GCM10030261 TaxID=3273420 RepID=UPI003619E81B
MRLGYDTWVIMVQSLRISSRQRLWAILGLAQPLYFVVLFGPLWERSLRMSSKESYATFLPGIFIEVAVFGTLFAGIGLVSEARAGLIERMRVTPVSRSALLLGRCGRDILMLLMQALILVVVAIPFGLPVRVVPLALTFLLMCTVAFVATSLSYALALTVESETTLASLANIVNVPLMLLSGILIPIAFAPDWLQTLARANPVYYAVEAARGLFGGDITTTALLRALVIVLGVGAIGGFWAIRRFSRAVS